jgi:hypothetical protein
MRPPWKRLPAVAPLVIVLLSGSLECRAQQSALPETLSPPILPADTPVPLRLTANLYKKDAKPGFPVAFEVFQDIVVDRHVIIPMGSIVHGTVQHVEPSGKGPARVLIALAPTQTVFGETVHFAAPKATTDDSSLGRPGLRDVGTLAGSEAAPALPVIVPVLAVMALFPGKKVLLHKDVEEVVRVAENVALDPAKLAQQAQISDSTACLHYFQFIFSASDSLRKTAQSDDALAACQRSFPQASLADLHFRAAELSRKKGDFVHAIPEYRTAVQLDPNVQDVRIGFIQALEEAGDFDAAIAESREAIRLWPGETYFHYLLGSALVGRNDPDAAIPELQVALQATKNRMAPANCSMGRALELKGDLPAAFTQYRAAYRAHLRDPECVASYQRLKLQLHR